MFNETGSPKPGAVKNQVQNEPPIDQEIDHQENNDATIHPPNMYGEWVYIAQAEDPIIADQAPLSRDAEK